MNVVAIVQARMGSSRLPGKVLLQLGNKKVLNHVFSRLKLAKNINELVLATSTSKEDDQLVEWAKNNKIKYFRGSEEDVLERYYETAKNFNADIVVRITSDCPCIDYEIVDRVVSAHVKGSYDYTSNVHPPSFPDGLDVEVFSFESLYTAHLNANNEKEREHVTPYIWKNIFFKKQNVKSDVDYSNLRFTIDTQQDFEFLSAVYEQINNENFLLQDLVMFVKNNPRLLELNHHLIRNSNF